MCEVTWSLIAVIICDQIIHHLFGLLKFKNAIFKILCSTAQHAGIAVHNHPPGGRHISTEIWQRLSSLFPFSRAFSAFPVFRLSLFSAFPSFPRFFKKQKPLRRREYIFDVRSLRQTKNIHPVYQMLTSTFNFNVQPTSIQRYYAT